MRYNRFYFNILQTLTYLFIWIIYVCLKIFYFTLFYLQIEVFVCFRTEICFICYLDSTFWVLLSQGSTVQDRQSYYYMYDVYCVKRAKFIFVAQGDVDASHEAEYGSFPKTTLRFCSCTIHNISPPDHLFILNKK